MVKGELGHQENVASSAPGNRRVLPPLDIRGGGRPPEFSGEWKKPNIAEGTSKYRISTGISTRTLIHQPDFGL